MHDMLFGLETELAFSASSGREQRPFLLERFFSLAHERLRSLPEARGEGLFLANGSRFYLDNGSHPELCTPECRTPTELVCWQLAGERLLVELAEELEKDHPGSSIGLFRCNVDYSGAGSTWGCHESYLHRKSAAEMAPHLIPHLVSRILYTGAGGFDNRSERLEFLLSPRVSHLVHEIGPDGSPERGIYHAKNEPLGVGGFSRLHLMCGESLSSQLANYLKVGTTALVVRLIDAGVCDGDRLAFESPLDAMRAFARDPRCSVRAKLRSGRRASALQVQRTFLEMVERQLPADFMPDWAPELCRRWRGVLERLDSDPGSLSGSLDWAIKHALFREHARRRRQRWFRQPARSRLGAQLFEIDTRFGELGEGGIFRSLDRAGALDHRIAELGSVEEAMRRPPPGGRAEARGNAIAALVEQRHRYVCRWDAIHDLSEDRMLDLGDPFAKQAQWRALRTPRVRRTVSTARQRRIRERIDVACHHYHLLQCDAALEALGDAMRRSEQAEDWENEAQARFWAACVYQDMGALEAARTVLAPALRNPPRRVSQATRCRLLTRLALVQIERPAPAEDVENTMELVRESVEGTSGRSRVTTLEGRLLAAGGQYRAAIAVTERAIRESAADPIAFCRTSSLRRIVDFALRLGDLERVRTGIEVWRAAGEAPRRSFSAVVLPCAESALARCEGRTGEALEQAARAVEQSADLGRQTVRLLACLAYVESAVAAGQPEPARPHLSELRSWHDVQIGELRQEIERVEALFGASGAGRASA